MRASSPTPTTVFSNPKEFITDYKEAPVAVHPIDSASTMLLASTWLKACMKEHRSYQTPQSYLPTRLVDVSSVGSSNVRLVANQYSFCHT
jgi:hypothetical protein